MIRAIIFHPKVIKVLSSEELITLKHFVRKNEFKTFLIAREKQLYKDVIRDTRDILTEFISEDKVGKKRGSSEYIHWITKKYKIFPYEILYIGQDSKRLDWMTSINGGTFYIHAAFVSKPPQNLFAVKSFKNLIRIIGLFKEMGNGLFSYQFRLDDKVERKFLFDIGTKIPVDGENNVHLANIIKPDYNRNFTIGGRPARESLLLLLLLQLWLSGSLNNTNYFIFYPGHKAGTENRLIKSYFTEIAKIAFKSYFKEKLIHREKDTLQKHIARLRHEYNKISFKNEFNTLCIKEKIPLKRRIIVIDDFTTTGLSLESAKLLLLSAGYQPENIKLVAIGKYGYTYDMYKLLKKINPFNCENKISEENYRHITYKTQKYRNPDREAKLTKILRRFTKI